MGNPAMTLHLTTAIGRARTEVGAFDRAVGDAGLANFNLVRLSSAIPPGSEIVSVESCPYTSRGQWGDRLYTVYAERRASRPGEQAWAGLGWVQDPTTGEGLFVEHADTRERAVREQITASLEDLQGARGATLGPIRMRVVGATCTGLPTCALVICAYGTEPWRRDLLLVDSFPRRSVAAA